MKIASLILIGGKNTRMNGLKKAFIEYKGYTFLEHSINSVKNISKVYLSVENIQNYENLSYTLIQDEYEEIGPIGGIYSGLKFIDADLIIVIPCDMPTINENIIYKLLLNYDEKPVVLCENNGKINPLIAIYTKNDFKIIQKMIEEKNYKMKCFFDIVEHTKVVINDECIKYNINSPSDLKKLNKKFRVY